MPKKKTDKETNLSEISKYQGFEPVTIHRGEIKNAPYNPRTISSSARDKLKKSLRQHGMIEGLVWNRQSGNLVGGHQRLSILDELERSQDYHLTVCAIDVDNRTEKAANVLLNNTSIQGEFDYELLGDLTLNGEVSFEEMGFDKSDVDIMFQGDERYSALFEESEGVANTKEAIDAIKEAKKKGREKFVVSNNVAYYVTVVFKSTETRDAFMKDIGVPNYEDFVTGDMLDRIRYKPNVITAGTPTPPPPLKGTSG